MNVFLFTEGNTFVGVEGSLTGNGEVSVSLGEAQLTALAPSTAAQVGFLHGVGGPTLESRPTWNFQGGLVWRDEFGTPLLHKEAV